MPWCSLHSWFAWINLNLCNQFPIVIIHWNGKSKKFTFLLLWDLTYWKNWISISWHARSFYHRCEASSERDCIILNCEPNIMRLYRDIKDHFFQPARRSRDDDDDNDIETIFVCDLYTGEWLYGVRREENYLVRSLSRDGVHNYYVFLGSLLVWCKLNRLKRQFTHITRVSLVITTFLVSDKFIYPNIIDSPHSDSLS